MEEKLTVITGMNLQQVIQLANKAGITRNDLVSIINMPNSREFNIVYWKKHGQSDK
jgi:hypothetical protein